MYIHTYTSHTRTRHRELIRVKEPLHALCIESTDPTVVTPQLPMHNRGTMLVQFSMAKFSCRELDSFLSPHTRALDRDLLLLGAQDTSSYVNSQ